MLANPVGVYRGIVTSTKDPSGGKRIRAQVPQISGAAEIRWAEPVNPGDPVPQVNSIVWISFHAGDINKPIYFNNSTYADGGDNVPWVNILLNAGFTNNGNSLGTVQARKITSFGTRWVEWRGGMDIASTGSPGSYAIPNSGIFAHIADSSYYPSSRRTIIVGQNYSGSTNSVKIDFNSNGDCQFIGTSSAPTLWASLHNVRYSL